MSSLAVVWIGGKSSLGLRLFLRVLSNSVSLFSAKTVLFSRAVIGSVPEYANHLEVALSTSS